MHHAFSSDAEIERIASGLKHRTLPKPDWTHAAHFAAALWLLKHGEAGAMSTLIRAYNESTGVANTDTSGYHETITQASLRAAATFLDRASLCESANALLASELGRSDWLLSFWSRERLFTPAARRTWVAPDLRALPYPELA